MNTETPNTQSLRLNACDEAIRLNLPYVSTEHILLAILRMEGCSAYVLLKAMDVDIEALRKKINEGAVHGAAGSNPMSLPFTPRAKMVMSFAAKEAHTMEHQCVGTEHVLIALIKVREGIAASALEAFRVDLVRLRSEVACLLKA